MGLRRKHMSHANVVAAVEGEAGAARRVEKRRDTCGVAVGQLVSIVHKIGDTAMLNSLRSSIPNKISSRGQASFQAKPRQ